MHAIVTFICVLLGATVGNVLGSIIKEALDDKFYRDLEKDMEEEWERSRKEKYDAIRKNLSDTFICRLILSEIWGLDFTLFPSVWR